MIHSNHEVKPHRARLVLPWGTRWEARVTNVLPKLSKNSYFFYTKLMTYTQLLARKKQWEKVFLYTMSVYPVHSDINRL